MSPGAGASKVIVIASPAAGAFCFVTFFADGDEVFFGRPGPRELLILAGAAFALRFTVLGVAECGVRLAFVDFFAAGRADAGRFEFLAKT